MAADAFIGAAIAFLCSEDARFSRGPVIAVNGGWLSTKHVFVDDEGRLFWSRPGPSPTLAHAVENVRTGCS